MHKFEKIQFRGFILIRDRGGAVLVCDTSRAAVYIILEIGTVQWDKNSKEITNYLHQAINLGESIFGVSSFVVGPNLNMSWTVECKKSPIGIESNSNIKAQLTYKLF